MAYSDNESDLSEAPTTTITPFSIAARSTASSSKPAQRTRNIAERRPVVPKAPPKPPKKRPAIPILRASNDHSPLTEIPIYVTGTPDEERETSAEKESTPEVSTLETPGPGSSVSQASGVKRTRPTTSSIHEFISRRGGQYACNRCGKMYSVSGDTGAIGRHLKKLHSIDPSPSGVAEKRIRDGTDVAAAILRGAEVNIKADEKRKDEIMGRHLDKNTLEYLYLQWTISRNIPFDQVRDRGFRTFLEYVNPIANQMLPDSDSTVKTHAEGLFAEGKQRLRHLLGTAISDIHITCDMWSSPNHLGLLAVVGHFTGEDSKLHTVTLALKELQGEHSGINQGAIVLDVLDDYGIRNKLGYMVMDNVGSNDYLIAFVADALHQDGVYYNAVQRRLRCNGHIINLAVQAFLFGKTVDDYEYPENLALSPSDAQLNQWRRLGPLGKLHNIVMWIMGSPQRMQSFKKRSEGPMPRRDNSTRWNSWFNMLDWVLKKLKHVIISVTNEEPDLAKDILTAEEWKILANIRDFLQAFHDATKATEGRRATLERVLPTMDFLANHFERAVEEYAQHDFMRESLHAGFTKLLKYWNKTERSPAYIAAIVLDPTKKWSYFKRWNPDWQPDMEAIMKMFWETTYRSGTGLATYASTTNSNSARETTNQFFLWENQLDEEQTTAVGDELDLYISYGLIPRKDGRTALDWWLEPEQRARFPLLSKMAIDIYSIPAMSSEPERVFSQAKRTISDHKASLKAETIELLECMKSWFRLGIFTQEDLNAIINTMEEGASLDGLDGLDE